MARPSPCFRLATLDQFELGGRQLRGDVADRFQLRQGCQLLDGQPADHELARLRLKQQLEAQFLELRQRLGRGAGWRVPCFELRVSCFNSKLGTLNPKLDQESALPVHLSPIPDLEDQYHEIAVANRVDDAKISHPQAVEVFLPFKLFDSARTWVCLEFEETLSDVALNGLGEFSELALGGGCDVDGVGHQSVLQAQLFHESPEGFGSLLVRLGEGGPRIFEVHTVLQRLKKPEIFNGHHGCHIFSAAVENDPLPTIRHAVHRVREIFSDFAGSHPAHWQTP